MKTLYTLEKMTGAKTKTCLWCGRVFTQFYFAATFRARVYFCSKECIIKWLIKEGRMKDPSKGIRGWFKRVFLKAS